MATIKALEAKRKKRRESRLVNIKAAHTAGKNQKAHLAAAEEDRKAIAHLTTLIKAKRKSQRSRPLRLRAYDHAKALLGVMEEGSNAGKVVSKIILANGGIVGEPWCGDTMAYVYRLAGSKAVTRSWAAVRLLRWAAGTATTSKPKRGHIVIYTFDHTGMFDRWLTPNDKDWRRPGDFYAIEGNTGGSSERASDDPGGTGEGVHHKVRNRDQVEAFVKVLR